MENRLLAEIKAFNNDIEARATVEGEERKWFLVKADLPLGCAWLFNLFVDESA